MQTILCYPIRLKELRNHYIWILKNKMVGILLKLYIQKLMVGSSVPALGTQESNSLLVKLFVVPSKSQGKGQCQHGEYGVFMVEK